MNYASLQIERAAKDYQKFRFNYKTGLFLIAVLLNLFMVALVVGAWLVVWG